MNTCVNERYVFGTNRSVYSDFRIALVSKDDPNEALNFIVPQDLNTVINGSAGLKTSRSFKDAKVYFGNIDEHVESLQKKLDASNSNFYVKGFEVASAFDKLYFRKQLRFVNKLVKKFNLTLCNFCNSNGNCLVTLSSIDTSVYITFIIDRKLRIAGLTGHILDVIYSDKILSTYSSDEFSELFSGCLSKSELLKCRYAMIKSVL